MKNSQRLCGVRDAYKSERLGIITGMLLGDASIVAKYPKNIVLCHTAVYADYLEWKGKLLIQFGYIKHKTRTMYPKLGNKAFIVDFSDDKNIFFYKKYYINGKRKATYQFIRHLNQYGLAIWFMDNGNLSKKGRNYLCLNTQAFPLEQQKVLQRMFKKRFGLTPAIHKDKKYYKLYFGTKDNNAERLASLIKPYIHSSFEYKLR